jgi:hypothetical protein
VTKLSISTGVFLVILGLVAYFATNAVSVTALIPTFFGLVFILLGYLGMKKEGARKHLMHGALVLAILGLGGSFGGLVKILKAFGGAHDFTAPIIAQSLMAIACIIFLIAGIRSFIVARMR